MQSCPNLYFTSASYMMSFPGINSSSLGAPGRPKDKHFPVYSIVHTYKPKRSPGHQRNTFFLSGEFTNQFFSIRPPNMSFWHHPIKLCSKDTSPNHSSYHFSILVRELQLVSIEQSIHQAKTNVN